jgi:holo-[acyl-carrier protein] synthase
MTIGIGTDVCDIIRIREAIRRQGDRFIRRVLTASEQAPALRPDPVRYLARRFAAKEAFVKALGTGITERIGWTDIEVLNSPSGAPVIALTGGAMRQVMRLAQGREGIVHVSLSGQAHFAMAAVAIEVR